MTKDLTARFDELRSECMQPLTQKAALAKQSSDRLSSRYEASRNDLERFGKSFDRMQGEGRVMATELGRLKTALDERLAELRRKLEVQAAESDRDLQRTTLAAMRGQESEFPAHRRRSAEVHRQMKSLHAQQEKVIGVFAVASKAMAGRLGADEPEMTTGSSVAMLSLDKRKIAFEVPAEVDSWMGLSDVLIAKDLLDPIPASVKQLVALDAATLKRRESAASEPKQKFLLRALQNYKRGLEQLEADSAALPGGWKPAWDGEKALVKHSKDRPASRRWMENDGFRTALVNKAYVYDALIRLRGGTTDSYDRFEMAHYLSEMIWCAKKLGHPFGDEIEQLVNGYVGGLNDRRALSAK